MAVERVCFADCQREVEECPCRQAMELRLAEHSLLDFLKNGGKPLEQVMRKDTKEGG